MIKKFLIISLFLIGFSCNKQTLLQKLSSKESELKSKGGYDSYLALEYLSFSRRLLIVKDNKTSEHFSKKAFNIINGKPFIPENPIKWKADLSRIEELVLMQKRLENLLNNKNLMFQMPIQLAHLSYLYDCWASKESKNLFISDDLSNCRVSFTKLIDEIEFFLQESLKDKAPLVKIIEPEFSRFEITFDAENYLLNDKATGKMIELIDYLSSKKGRFKILITANPDNSSNNKMNQILVRNRFEVVKNYLLKNGVDENEIEERIENEDFPDIIANEEIKNQINRSVGVYVLIGQGDFKPYPLPLLQNLLYKAQIEKARTEQGLE
jgi:outer membrane protein OmpA-like peptidoglycan-associated protein